MPRPLLFLASTLGLLSLLTVPIRSSAESIKAVCMGSQVRVRAHPDSSGAVRTHLQKGQVVSIVSETAFTVEESGRKAKWYEIYGSSTTGGWVYGGFLDFPNKSSDSFPLPQVLSFKMVKSQSGDFPYMRRQSISDYYGKLVQSGFQVAFSSDSKESKTRSSNYEAITFQTNDFEKVFLIARGLWGQEQMHPMPPETASATQLSDTTPFWTGGNGPYVTIKRNESGKLQSVGYFFKGEGGGQTLIIERKGPGSISIAEHFGSD